MIEKYFVLLACELLLFFFFFSRLFSCCVLWCVYVYVCLCIRKMIEEARYCLSGKVRKRGRERPYFHDFSDV